MIELKTERLIIRHLNADDAPDFFEYRSDPEANKFQGWIPKSLQDAENFIRYRISEKPNIPDTWIQLGIILKKSGKLIGDIGVYFLPDKDNEVRLGYTLSKDHQGSGYASEALRILIDHLMIAYDKTRFIALIAPDNHASIRLVKRLNFILKENTGDPASRDEEYPEDLLYVLEI